jgi:hypothetical protein
MFEKISFLNEMKHSVLEKTFNRWFCFDNFVFSQKTVCDLVNEIFEFLSLDDVYVNVLDTNFEKLIINDLTESLINFASPFKDYEFLSNFKRSISQLANKERDKMIEFLKIHDFEKLRPILEVVVKNKDKGGRPGYDVVFMFKVLFIKVYYDLSDEKTARRIRSDDVCRAFLNYPEKFPCKSTIWNFRDKLAKIGLYDQIWKTFKIVTMEGKYRPGKFVRQDSSFYTENKGQKKKDYPRGDEAKTTRSAQWNIFQKKITKHSSDPKSTPNKT